MLIYDPKLERAFVKDFVLIPNQREFMYPEYPIIKGTEVKIVQNMWRKWIDDTPESMSKCFKLEIEKFDMNRFIKAKSEISKSRKMLSS